MDSPIRAVRQQVHSYRAFRRQRRLVLYVHSEFLRAPDLRAEVFRADTIANMLESQAVCLDASWLARTGIGASGDAYRDHADRWRRWASVTWKAARVG